MAKSDGSVIIDTRMDTKGFGKGVHSMQQKVGGLTGAVGKLGLAIGAAFSVVKLVQFGKEAIDLGSDLQEVQNVVDVTFTTMNEAVNEFARNAAETAGLSETMAKRYTGTFGAMAKAFGFAEEQSFQMSTALTQLAGDVASFYNLTQDEAYTKLKSVFTGETETLKDLGVVMTQSALDSFAMAEGYGKTTKAMSEQEKVALRFAFVTKQLNAASGDFIRTQDSWANQTRILSLNFDSFKANIGQALINVFTPLLKIINQLVSKMAQLSSHFVAFSEMLVGKSTSGGGGSPGEVLGEITSGYEDITDATQEAAKAQNKYLTGLDEIRTFQEKESETSGASSGMDLGSIAESSNILTESETAVSGLIEKIKELTGLFKEGFAEGLGDTESRLKSLRESVVSIKDSFAYIFDADLAAGFNNALDRIVRSFGVITGSVASIGLTIATNLVGGFSKYLEDNKERIKQYLLDMFDIGASIWEKFGDLTSTFSYIFEEFASEAGQQLTANVIEMFANSFMEISELAAQLGLDIVSVIVDPVKNSKEELRAALGELLVGYEEYTASVKEILNDSFGIVRQIYDKTIGPVFETLKEELANFYQKSIAPLATTLGEFFGSLGEGLNAIWNKTLEPFLQWITDNILPVLTPIFDYIVNTFFNIGSVIAGVTQGIIQILDGMITFLEGKFTGNWEKTWEGIKDIFRGIFNSLITIIEGFINSAIDTINGLIDGVNKISSKIGVRSIPNIPEVNIPMLATGAVIPPNAPFMAVLGDQRRGTNIEAPEALLRKVVREESGNNRGGGSYTFQGTINRRVLFEEFIEEAKLQMSMTGHNPLDLSKQ